MAYQDKKITFIYNARLITENFLIKKGWVIIKDGRIFAIGINKKAPRFKNKVLRINASNHYLAPGFIDLHIHGDPVIISNKQSKYGTTGFLLGLHADRVKNTCVKIDKIRRLSLKGARCLGFHLEGPFINREMAGAQPKKFIKNPDLQEARYLIKNTGRFIKIVTLACELAGAHRLIKIFKKNNIVTGLGHTNATFEQAKDAVKSGANYATHVFNRMSGILARNPGVSAEVLLDDKIAAEVIADGKHVHPALLRLLLNNKPADKIVLVTDSVSAMGRKMFKKADGVYLQKNSIIAGSNLTMIQAVKNMVQYNSIDIPCAVRMASLNPAVVIGLKRRKGVIKPGKDADLVIFDKKFKVRMTIIGGKVLYNNSLQAASRRL